MELRINPLRPVDVDLGKESALKLFSKLFRWVYVNLKHLIFHNLRVWRLKQYKSKKVKLEKTAFNREYLLKFKIKINDTSNPQMSNHELKIIVPAQAAFFAKRKALEHIQNSVELVFTGVDEIIEED